MAHFGGELVIAPSYWGSIQLYRLGVTVKRRFSSILRMILWEGGMPFHVLRLSGLMAVSLCGMLLFNNCSQKPSADEPSSNSGNDATQGGWTRYAQNPVILPGVTLGSLGRVSINAADPSVMYDSVDGIWKMWFASAFDQNNNYTPPVLNSRVGLNYAVSTNGLSWSVDTFGVLLPTSVTGGSTSDWDYTNVETPTVIRNPDPLAPAGRRYMMWYAGGNKLAGTIVASGHPYYQIGLAFSADGKTFTRLPANESPYNLPGLVLRSVDTVPAYPSPATGVAADPHVIYRQGKFHLWFSNITYTNTSEALQTAGISYASSTNGATWTPAAGNPLTSLWRANVAVGWQPSVVWNTDSNQYEMWFTGDTDAENQALGCRDAGAMGFFKAVSSDGLTWTPDYTRRDFEGDRSNLEEACNLITGVEVVRRPGRYYLYYSSYGTKNFPPLLSAAGYPWVWTISVSTK